jgi:acyl-CoA thioesterase FadM
VDIHLVVRKKTKKSITYDFEFSKPGGHVVARGSVTTLCVTMDPSTKQMTTIPIPKPIDETIEAAPVE